MVNDMSEVKKLIKELSSYNVSIIIVGIGTGPFGEMTNLDEMKGPNGRDIVQFVEANKFATMSDCTVGQYVLAEIPAQVVACAELMSSPKSYFG